jgi:hypothetical protein
MGRLKRVVFPKPLLKKANRSKERDAKPRGYERGLPRPPLASRAAKGGANVGSIGMDRLRLSKGGPLKGPSLHLRKAGCARRRSRPFSFAAQKTLSRFLGEFPPVRSAAGSPPNSLFPGPPLSLAPAALGRSAACAAGGLASLVRWSSVLRPSYSAPRSPLSGLTVSFLTASRVPLALL